MKAAAHPFLSHPKPIAFAHRGGGDPLAENTMSAFAAAVELGYRYLETDVRATIDGTLVAFHDDDLSRTSGRRGRISRMTWAEVAGVRMANGHSIPRLDEVLQTWPDVRMNLDVKHRAAVQPLAALIEAARAADRVCIASFSRRRLLAVRDILGDGPCYALDSLGVAKLWIRHRFGRESTRAIKRTGASVVQIPSRFRQHELIDRSLIERCDASGLDVHAWTINSKEEIDRLIDVGVGGIITDRTELLKATLEDRGLWQ